MATTTLKFKGFTEEMYNNAQEMAKDDTVVKYFGIIEGTNRVEYTAKFVGKRYSIQKFACAYVNAYLAKNPVKGITDASYKNGEYVTNAWTITGLDINQVCNLFDEIAKAGMKMYYELNPEKKAEKAAKRAEKANK